MLFIPLVVWLAWKGEETWLWWLGTLFGIPATALILFALYGIVETERNVPFSPVHLFLLPFVTVAAAGIAWWGLARQRDGEPTRIGRAPLWLARHKGELSDRTATVALVNPRFYTLLGVTLALNILFVVVEPLYLTNSWHLNRAVLLSIVLGFPVAALTYLTLEELASSTSSASAASVPTSRSSASLSRTVSSTSGIDGIRVSSAVRWQPLPRFSARRSRM